MEPFYTTKPIGKGTGLGLSSVYATAKAHGGSFTIQSEPGLGTVALVLLPAVPEAVVPGDPSCYSPQIMEPLKILLVDDDALIRAAIPPLMEVFGHGVSTVAGGHEGLALLEAGQDFDLVILDLNMPGMNGLETLAQIRELRPDLPILLATGHLETGTAELLKLNRHVFSIAKPFTIGEMDKKLREIYAKLPSS